MAVDTSGFDEYEDPHDVYMDSLTGGQRKRVMRGEPAESQPKGAEEEVRRVRWIAWPTGQVLRLTGMFYQIIGKWLRKWGERLIGDRHG